jgi:hypothetical protein
MVIYMNTEKLNIVNRNLYFTEDRNHLIEILILKEKGKFKLHCNIIEAKYSKCYETGALSANIINEFFSGATANRSNFEIIERFLNCRIKAELLKYTGDPELDEEISNKLKVLRDAFDVNQTKILSENCKLKSFK